MEQRLISLKINLGECSAEGAKL